MNAQNTKTIELECGGSVTLSIDVDLFTLKGVERDFVFDLIEIFNEVEENEIKEKETPKPQPPKLERKSYVKITEQVKQAALEMVSNGSTVSAAAAKLGVHRNSLANAGIKFGGQVQEPLTKPVLPPLACSDCGGQRSTGSASRCKDCYDKQVAANKEAEEKYKAQVAERKREKKENGGTFTEVSGVKAGQRFSNLIVETIKQERGSANRPYSALMRCDCGKSRKIAIHYLATAYEEGDYLACVDCTRAKREEDAKENFKTPEYSTDQPDEVLQLAEKLFHEHLAQCKKMSIRSDTRFQEFVRNAREIIEWQKRNPGQSYLDRYEGKIGSEDFSRQNYSQYQSPRARF